MQAITRTIKPITSLIRQQPVLAIFEINLQCNSECGYCDLPLNKGRYEMSRQEIQRVFTHLYEQGLRYVFLQGGEPTLRKDLFEVMQDLETLGYSQTLITNGTRLTREFIEKLNTLPVSISISLDTLDRERYKLIRGADQLNLVLNGIERLSDYSHPKYITCIVSEQNKDDALDVVRFARERGFIPVIGAYHWDIERYGKIDPVLQYQKQTAVRVFEQVLDSGLVPRGYFRDYIRDNIRWLNGDALARCDAGRYSIAIDCSGNVAPCLALTHTGNLLRSSLQDILAGFDKAQIESCSDRSSCNMMCSRVVGSTIRHPVSAMMTPDHIPAINC